MKATLIILFMLFVSVNQPILAQKSESSINLLISASEEDQAKLATAYRAKVKHIEQAGRFKRVQLVKVGNLAKIQKKGVLTFTVPGSSDRITFIAREVKAMSESDFTWVGYSAHKLSTAIFICKNGELSGTFSINGGPFELFYPNGRGFQLYSLGEGLSVLLEGRTDLSISCDAK